MIDYKDRDYIKLYNHILNQNRYIYGEEVKEILNNIVKYFKKREDIIPLDSVLYRAQKGCDFDDDEIPVPYGHNRMLPLDKNAKEGRANPKGIPYVYLANKDYIAISEVRSWVGEMVSLGLFTNIRELKVVDFSSDKDVSLIIDTIKLHLLSTNSMESTWAEINKAFSKPVSVSDNNTEYILTQVIAELVKNQGYDGLYYNSYYSKDEGDGKNIVVFDKKLLKLRRVGIYEIKKVDIDFEECNNPNFY